MKIFVSVGTSKFDMLIEKVDELVGCGFIDGANVSAQIGFGRYVPKNIKNWFRLTKHLNKYLQKADLIICHGGAGILFEALKYGKKIIAVPNPQLVEEHQLELVKKLESMKLVLSSNLQNLKENIAKVSQTTFSKYKSPACKIHTIIKRFLSSIR
ncbi:MAG: PssE/Cps14G family polysaccharide biosynthesis glycosyltransferase [Candidatus Odinarchaeia archaeon]